jgi:endonuclease/exonuclease/phosphatase family metal-dependent hydrolase
MSYNIKGFGSLFGRSHIEDIARVIRDANPDVVGLQEVHRRTWQSRFRDQAAELQQATGMNAFFGRSFGDDRKDYGNALLTRGTIVDGRVELLPGKGEQRSLLSSTIDLDGLRLHAYVTHLAAWGRFGSKTRLLQAKAVAELTARSELPFVLTGDFNSDPTSDELRVFHEGELVMSCFVGDVVTHRATRSCLDYIFVDTGWTIRESKVLPLGPSDHWPLVAEIERDRR